MNWIRAEIISWRFGRRFQGQGSPNWFAGWLRFHEVAYADYLLGGFDDWRDEAKHMISGVRKGYLQALAEMESLLLRQEDEIWIKRRHGNVDCSPIPDESSSLHRADLQRLQEEARTEWTPFLSFSRWDPQSIDLKTRIRNDYIVTAKPYGTAGSRLVPSDS